MRVVSELTLADIDLNSPDLAGDAYHRTLAGVAGQGDVGWLASSPVAYVVLDRDAAEFFLRARGTAFPGPQIADLFGVTSGRLREVIDANILNQTGDRHRRLRSLVSGAFTPRAANRWRPAMRGFLAGLWQAIEAGHSCDAAAAIARPYPALTIAAVLGAPQQDAGRLQVWSTLIQRQFDIHALSTQLAEMEQAAGEAYAYIENLLFAQAGQPGENLLAQLLAAEQAGDRLSHAECVNLVLDVIAGGVDTTSAQLGHALRLFAAHPQQWQALRADLSLVPAAVEEVLRFEPITPVTARLCAEPVEYRGVLFPAGTIVAVCAERGNRQQPGGEDFSITAPRDGRLLTFGAGPHFCLGRNLARAELEEALTFLAPRMADLAPAGPEVLGSTDGIYGVESLPLRWA